MIRHSKSAKTFTTEKKVGRVATSAPALPLTLFSATEIFSKTTKGLWTKNRFPIYFEFHKQKIPIFFWSC